MKNKIDWRSLSRRELVAAVGAGSCALLAGCASRNDVNSVSVQNETTAVRSVSIDVLDEDGNATFDETVELLPGEQLMNFSNKIVVRSDVTYTVRVRVDGGRTRSGQWDMQDEEMLVRVRESDVVFADGCPLEMSESGPSVEVYNLTGGELTARLTVESADMPATTHRPGSDTVAPTTEARSPSSSADWSTLVEEEFTLAGRSTGTSVRRYCGVEQGQTRVRVSTGDGREKSGVFSIPNESVKLLVVVFEEEVRLLQTGFCHFGC